MLFIKLTIELRNKLLNYLSTKPFSEVNNLIMELASVPQVVQPDDCVPRETVTPVIEGDKPCEVVEPIT